MTSYPCNKYEQITPSYRLSVNHISLLFNFLRNFRVKYQESSIGFENLANLQSIKNKCKAKVESGFETIVN